jgi:gliding motility-associated-like protein
LVSPNIQIVGEPVSAFTYAYPNPCETHRVQFTSNATVPLGPIAVLLWDFGDGNTSNQPNPLHQYPIQTNSIQGYQVTLIVGNQYGCTDTLTDSVFVYPALNPAVAGDTTICAGGSAPLLATGGFLYNWTPATGLSCTTCPNPIASPAATTTYNVQISDGNQCIYNLQVTVGVSGFPTAAFNASYPDPCQSQEILFTNQSNTPNGTLSVIQWTFGDGNTGTQFSPLHVYPTETDTVVCYPVHLYVENNFGCADSTLDTVCVYPVLNPQVFGDTTICAGGAAPLLATGGYLYDWTPANGLSCTTCTDPIATPAVSTTYNVAFSNGNGCLINLPITVGVSGIPTADFAVVYPDPCQSHIIQFSNISTTPTGSLVDIQWNFGDPAGGTSNLTNPGYTYPVELVQNQNYSVTLIVANEFTCADTITETVIVYPILTPQISADTLICFGDSAQLSASGGPIITWAPPTGLSCTFCSDPVASPPTTTIYAALYNNGNGCTETRNVTVSVSNVTPTLTPTQGSICEGGSLPISVASLDGTVYTWSPGNGLSCTNCPNPVASPDSTITYTVTVTDGGNCVDSASITVTVNFPPILTMNGDTSLCAGQPTLIQAIPVGNGPFVFQWDPNAAGLTSYFIPSPIATPVVSTVYAVTVTDANLCESYGSVTVDVLPIPAYTLTPPSDSICPGDTVQFNITPANVAVSYYWTPAYPLDNDTIPNPIAVPLESTAFIVTMTFPNTCTIRDTALIWMIELADLGAGPDLTVCYGDSVQLQGSSFGNASFTWSPGNLISGDSTLQNPYTIDSLPFSPVTFYAEIDRRGCTVLDSMLVTVIEKIELTVSRDTAICLGDSVQIFAQGGDTYIWSPVDGLSDPNLGNPIASPTISTQYQVIGSLGACESDTALVTLTVRNPPTIAIEADRTTFYPGDIVNLNAVPQYAGYGYTWSPAGFLSCAACPDPGAFPDQTTTFYLTVTDDLGCASTDSVTLRLRDRCVEEYIVVPNGFSPNGDGVNDVLYVRGIPNIETFAVYNRWGEQVFETNNILEGWDGTQNGKPVEAGVYVWFVVAPCPIDGTTFKKTGNVTIVK